MTGGSDSSYPQNVLQWYFFVLFSNFHDTDRMIDMHVACNKVNHNEAVVAESIAKNYYTLNEH